MIDSIWKKRVLGITEENRHYLVSEAPRIFDGMLKGKVLTIIEASVANEQQCKAIKDVIKDTFKQNMEIRYQVAQEVYEGKGTSGQVWD